MNFDLKQFVDTNKRVFIWSIFFGLLYLIRGLFGLVFLTYILCFSFNNAIKWLSVKTRLPRRLWTVVLYLVFVALVTTLLSIVGPKLGMESTLFIKQMPETVDKIHGYLDRLAESQPSWTLPIIHLKENLSLEALVGMDRQALVTILVASFNKVTHYFSYFGLGTLFSFFILFDFPNLREKTRALRDTRLKAVYEETAGSVAKFALVVGEAFQAQLIIACVNTFLTSIGLWGLGIGPIALLATIVFFAGLIPVLGVFLSSAPIILLGFNTGGFQLMLAALIMIIVVHAVEAYILNPNIFSAMLKINPVLTLIILYIGHSLFGFWGIILGVPVSVYIYRHVILNRSVDK